MEIEQIQSDQVYLIHDFLTPQECELYIAHSEAIGFRKAPITTLAGPVMAPEVRNNSRVMIDDYHLAEVLFKRARPLLPEIVDGWKLAGFNERLRYYRYNPGEKFARHFDGYYKRNSNEVSKLTFMLYLNDSFEGGETRFFVYPEAKVVPEKGMALVFVHKRLHEGCEVKSGTKYVLRTDVLYSRWSRAELNH